MQLPYLILWMSFATAASPGGGNTQTGRTRIGGTSTRGLGGIHHLVAGYQMDNDGLVATGQATFAEAQGLLVADDKASLVTARANLMWHPLASLEVALDGRLRRFTDSAFAGTTLLVGEPTLSFKWSRFVGERVGLGMMGSLFIPVGTNGLQPADLAVEAGGVLSWLGRPWLELTANAAMVIDRSGNELVHPQSNAAQIFGAGGNRTHHIDVGVGLLTRIPLDTDAVILSPYGEVAGEFTTSTRFANNPIGVNLGTKLITTSDPAIEIDLGCELRANGRPAYDSPYAGLMPWTLFARLALHTSFGRLDAPTRLAPPAPRNAWSTTPGELMFVGRVTDTSGLPLSDAKITVTGLPSIIAVDPITGTYDTPPVQVFNSNTVAVVASALGYAPQTQVVPLAHDGNKLSVDFRLALTQAVGHIQVIILSESTGVPLAGATVLLPALQGKQLFTVDKMGHVTVTVKSGHYEMVVSAPGYATQSKTVRIDENQTFIVNIALKKLAKRHQPRHLEAR